MITSSDEVGLVERKSAPETVADALRERITAGALSAGAKISVEKVARSMGVSANTLREALQLLEHERLVTQYLNRGIFVRVVTPADISDLYTMRRLLEIGTLNHLQKVPADGIAALRAAVDDGYEALARGDWNRSSLATVKFHSALVAMLGSQRATVTMQRLMAELRLTLAQLAQSGLRSAFLDDRRRIVEHLENGDITAAAAILVAYLERGEKSMLALHADADAGAGAGAD